MKKSQEISRFTHLRAINLAYPPSRWLKTALPTIKHFTTPL